MNKKYFLTACLLVLVLVVSAWTQSKPTEYKFEYSPKEKKVNELASQGWELVAIDSSSGIGNPSIYVFKR